MLTVYKRNNSHCLNNLTFHLEVTTILSVHLKYTSTVFMFVDDFVLQRNTFGFIEPGDLSNQSFDGTFHMITALPIQNMVSWKLMHLTHRCARIPCGPLRGPGSWCEWPEARSTGRERVRGQGPQVVPKFLLWLPLYLSSGWTKKSWGLISQGSAANYREWRIRKPEEYFPKKHEDMIEYP